MGLPTAACRYSSTASLMAVGEKDLGNAVVGLEIELVETQRAAKSRRGLVGVALLKVAIADPVVEAFHQLRRIVQLRTDVFEFLAGRFPVLVGVQHAGLEKIQFRRREVVSRIFRMQSAAAAMLLASALFGCRDTGSPGAKGSVALLPLDWQTVDAVLQDVDGLVASLLRTRMSAMRMYMAKSCGATLMPRRAYFTASAKCRIATSRIAGKIEPPRVVFLDLQRGLGLLKAWSYFPSSSSHMP